MTPGDDRTFAGRLVDAATLAGLLGVSRGWVYRHREMLGAVRLGLGPRPRLRFDADAAVLRLGGSGSQGPGRPVAPADARPSARPVRRRSPSRGRSFAHGEVPLLPVGPARGRRP